MHEMNEDPNGVSDRMAGELLPAMASKLVDMDKILRDLAAAVKKGADGSDAEKKLSEQVLTQEILLKELNGVIGETKADITKILEKTSVRLPVDQLEGLRHDLVRHRELFEKPLKKSIHHTHYAGKPLWVIIGLALGIAGLLYFLNCSVQRADTHAENDLKWRYLKLTHDSTVLKNINLAEDVYKADPVQFGKDVLDEEDRRERLYKRWLQVNENMREIDKLEGERKGR